MGASERLCTKLRLPAHFGRITEYEVSNFLRSRR